MKDHELRELVNSVTQAATEFAGTQQLRERIAHLIVPPILAAQAEVKGLREALRFAKVAIKGREHTGFIDAALAKPSDLSALSAHDAGVRKEALREVADLADADGHYALGSDIRRMIAELDQPTKEG